MRFTIFSAAICGLFSINTPTIAQTSYPSESHKPNIEILKPGDTFICIGRESIGFDWVDGEWRKKNFKVDKWLIRKEESDSAACNLRDEEDKKYSFNNYESWNLRRCFSYKKFGSKQELGSFINTGVCHESYSTKSQAGPQVQCTNFIFLSLAFMPNGAFMIQTANPSIPAEAQMQVDSKFYEVGTCSSM
jgi:hypothetical protein